MSRSDKNSQQYLPKYIRDELRMTVALRCYSTLREGNGKKLSELYSCMFDRYHGNQSTSVASNLKLLCNASYVFKNLFDENLQNTTRKSNTSDSNDVVTHVLKPKLTRGSAKSFTASVDITVDDLEKKNRSGPQLMSGRQLLDMAKRGTKFYRKALAYASRKYDLDTMQCKESGNTIDDVIEYVIVQMYKDSKKKDNNDSDDIVEEENELEEEVIIDTTTEEGTTVSTISNTNQSPTSNDPNINVNEESQGNAEEETDDVIVPSDWIFPSFFSFIAFGPFVSKENRLSLLEITDAHQNVGKSRASKRKADKIEKDNARDNDTENERGFSTDQQLQVKMLKIQEKKEDDRARETILVGLSIQESALSREIQRAEDRAMRLAANDEVTRNGIYWKHVDALLKSHVEVMKKINTINEIGMKTQETINQSNEITVPSHVDTCSTPLLSPIGLGTASTSDITSTPNSKQSF